MTTNSADDILFGLMKQSSGGTTWTIPSGWTSGNAAPGDAAKIDAWDIVASSVSSQAETWIGQANGYNINGICDAIRGNIAPITITGTLEGSTGQTICVMPGPTLGSSVSASCPGFTDYDTAVTMGALTVSANERWSPSTLAYTDTTGGNTHSDRHYYEQLQNTYQVTSNFIPSVNSLALDGAGDASGACGGTSSCTVTLTTTHANDVIVVVCAQGGDTLKTPTDTAELAWNQRGSAYGASSARQVNVYWAYSSGTLSSDSITCASTNNAATDYWTVEAWGISGANPASPFDSNAALPAQFTSSAARMELAHYQHQQQMISYLPSLIRRIM